MRRPVILASLLLLVLAAPAQAGWGAHGSHEPDTMEDVEGRFMFLDPPQTPGAKVYFNAFPSVQGLAFNPNLGATGSRVSPVPTLEWRAILGVWTDCNKDGYVGMAETALAEYRNEMLVDKSLCPVQPRSGIVHNDGVWVTEFFLIGMVDPCEFKPDAHRASACGNLAPFNYNPVVLYSNDTYVWGDEGTPGAPGENACRAAPLPRGTTSGTGALLRQADCYANGEVALAVNRVDADGGLGLRFDEPREPQRSDSLLNQHFPVNLFGNPTTGQAGLLQRDTERPAATVWDCASPTGTAAVGSPTGSDEVLLHDPSGTRLSEPRVIPIIGRTSVFVDHDNDPNTAGQRRVQLGDGRGNLVWAPRVTSPSLDGQGSAWDAAVLLADGARGDCDADTPQAFESSYPFDAVEDDVELQRAGERSQPSFSFTFYDGYRSNAAIYSTAGRNFPTDFGNPYQRNSHGGALWIASGFSTAPLLVTRDTLAPEAPRISSFYAWVGDLRHYSYPPGEMAIYGAEACPAIGTGASPANGWLCDPALWWRDANGRDITPAYAEGMPYGRRVGDPYHLRDVDCLDGTLVAGTPLAASLTPISEHAACPDMGGLLLPEE